MKYLISGILAFALFSFGSTAAAETLEDLDVSLSAQQAEKSDAYAFIAHVRDQIPSLQARARGPYAVVGPMLEGYGSGALDPMLRELIEDRAFGFAGARRAWRIGLLHAVGRMHAERARPVLQNVIETDPDSEVVKAASNALGKMLDLEAARYLIAASVGNSDRARAVLAGMGTCRRAIVARHLADKLTGAEDRAMQLAAILSLRDVANSWAWKTSRVAASGEHKATAETARKALVDSFFKRPELESEITKALLIVNDPKTSAAVSKRNSEASARATRLVEKLENNPLNR